jgi:hypothetical protein
MRNLLILVVINLFIVAIIITSIPREFNFIFGDASSLSFELNPNSIEQYFDITDNTIRLSYKPRLITTEAQLILSGIEKQIFPEDYFDFEIKFKVPEQLESLNMNIAGQNYLLYNSQLSNLGEANFKSSDVYLWTDLNEEENLLAEYLENNEFQNHVDRIYLKDYSYSIQPVAEDMKRLDLGIRGEHRFIAYFPDDNIDLIIEKYDLNWYEGEDTLTVRIKDYFTDELIYEQVLDDDGIIGGSLFNQGYIQNLKLNIDANPGIYEIDLIQADSIISGVEGNFDKLVFDDFVYVTNSDLYTRNLIGSKESEILSLFLSGNDSITISTNHLDALGEGFLNDTIFSIDEINSTYTLSTDAGNNKLELPKQDYLVKFKSYASVNEETYFNPDKYIISNLATDVSITDNYAVLSQPYLTKSYSDEDDIYVYKSSLPTNAISRTGDLTISFDLDFKTARTNQVVIESLSISL